jgi:hypothetical protein
LFLEEVGAHVGTTICKKSPAETTMAMVEDKLQEVAVPRLEVLAVADFVRLFGWIGESFFEVKKFTIGIKDLKNARSEAQNQRNKPPPPKNFLPPPMLRIC